METGAMETQIEFTRNWQRVRFEIVIMLLATWASTDSQFM